MKENRTGVFLRWPWNLILYVLLLAVLRLFAIPIILLLMWAQQKNNPNGVQEGYCLTRTRKRISWLAWGVASAVVGGVLLYMFSVGRGLDHTYFDREDYVTLWGCAVTGGLLIILGLYLIYTGGRDVFLPEKSALAQSIRDQLPYPEEAPPVGELFAMVDGDLKEHGQWFGAAGIGQEWVLGDQATRIDRIRGIFTVDEIRQHTTQTGSRTSRNLELVLIDDRWQKNVIDFRDPQALRAAADCLSLRVPEARRGVNDQRHSFMNMDESEREDFEREFRQKQGRRAAAQVQKEAMYGGPQDMILSSGDDRTSRVSMPLVEDHLRRCAAGEERRFTLTPTRPIEGEGGGFRAIHISEAEGLVRMETETADGHLLTKSVSEQEARRILAAWLRREAPDARDWTVRRAADPSLENPRSRPKPVQTRPDELALIFASGAAEHHTTFTQEDVEVAAEGIADGTYQMVALSRNFLWIRVEAGDKSDGRCMVRASRPDPDKLRFFSTKTTPRQAASWLLAYSTGNFLPGGPDWKDYTKEVEKVK